MTADMPTKNPPRRRKSAKDEGALEIVVRRGATRRFDALKSRTADLGVVVNWDRRTEDRRAAAARSVRMEVPRERRDSDRRQKAPFTWELADFVVVQRSNDSKATEKKRTKKVSPE